MNILRKYKISKILNTPLEGKEKECITFMKEFLNSLILFKHEKYPKSIFYMNSNGDWIFEIIDNCFYVRYLKIWVFLEIKYSMEFDDIKYFIKYMFEERFKQKIGIPKHEGGTDNITIEEDFKKQVINDYKKFIMKDFNI